MSTGPEHYREAEILIAFAFESKGTTFEGHNPEADRCIAAAQVHATLALTAATAQPGAYGGEQGLTRDQREWSTAVRPAPKPQEVDEDA